MRIWTILWPIIIGGLLWLGAEKEWEWFYFILSCVTVLHAFFPIRIRQGRKLAWGACMMFASYVTSVWFLEEMSYTAALIPHSLVNIVLAGGFLVITLFDRAFWSAICVALHAAMLVWTYWFFKHPGASLLEFQQVLNGLYIGAHVIINLAIYAGGRKWGEKLDGALSRLTGLSFTGLRGRRLYPR